MLLYSGETGFLDEKLWSEYRGVGSSCQFLVSDLSDLMIKEGDSWCSMRKDLLG